MILAECQFRKRPMSSPVYLAMMYSTMTRNAAKPIFIIAAVRWRLIWIRLCSTIKRTVEVSRRSMSAGIRPDETVTATHPKPIQNQIQRDGREMGRKRWGGWRGWAATVPRCNGFLEISAQILEVLQQLLSFHEFNLIHDRQWR